MQRPFVSVIIPTRDRKEQLLRLLATVAASAYPAERLETIVVDNISADGTSEAVAAAYPQAQIVRATENLWCAGGRNAGAAQAKGEYLFFVDDDNLLDPQCIGHLVDALERDSEIAIAAPLMLYPGEPARIWSAAGTISPIGIPGYTHSGALLSDVRLPATYDADFFPNAYMLRGSLARSGFLHDAKSFPHNWSEADLCARLKGAGHALRTVTAARTVHDIGYVSWLTRVGVDKTYDQARSRVRFRRRHLRNPGSWAIFWLLIFPVSTLAYLRAFFAQRDVGVGALLRAYVRGTVDGFRQPV